MPIIDTQDARELDGHLQRFFDANPSDRPHRLRQLFTEKFDFNPTTGKVSLAKAPQNITLPSDADRIASIEGINVVYVPLEIPGTTRVRKAEAVTSAKLVANHLGDDMLLLMTNEQAGDGASQLHVILPTFVGSTPALRASLVHRVWRSGSPGSRWPSGACRCLRRLVPHSVLSPPPSRAFSTVRPSVIPPPFLALRGVERKVAQS